MGTPPPPGGYFATLPPGSTLPDETSAAAQVHRSTWEPKPENIAPNHYVVPQPTTLGVFSQFNSYWNAHYRPRVTGNFTGTTDEIIQWAACKWGWNDDLLRAQCVTESTWRQSNEGDFEPRANAHFTYDDARDPAPTSFSIIQVKWYFHPSGVASNSPQSSYPYIKLSTAFALDLFLAEMRGIYDGMSSYLGNTLGDQNGAIGVWFSGAWHASSDSSYVGSVLGHYNTKPWLSWQDFGDSDSGDGDSGTIITSPEAPSAITELYTITGRYRSIDSGVANGNVIISLTDPRVIDTTDDLIVDQQPLSISLDSDGAFAQNIIQTTGYHVTENVNGITNAPPGYVVIAPSADYDMSDGAVATTEPSFFFVSGNWTNLDGSPTTGKISFTPVDERFVNNENVILQETVTVPLDANGAMTQKLVQATNGYTVVEAITGSPVNVLTIAGTANIKLSGGTAITVPGPPLSVAATMVDEELVVIWTPPTSDGGLPVTDYRVSVTASSPAYNEEQTFLSTDFYVADFDNIVADVAYTIVVIAHNGAGFGSSTTVVLVATSPDVNGRVPINGADNSGGPPIGDATTVPNPPENLTVTYANGTVYLAWTRPSTGSAPLQYVVGCSGQSNKVIPATGALWQKCLYGQLNVGGTRTVTVQSQNLAGISSAVTSTGTVAIARPDTLTGSGDRIAGYTAYSSMPLVPYDGPTYFTSNTLLEGYLITGPVTAAVGVSVTLVGCKIQGSPGAPGPVVNPIGYGTVAMLYCEISGEGGSAAVDAFNNSVSGTGYGIYGQLITAYNCYIHQVTHGVHVAGSNNLVQYCYIIDQVSVDSSLTPYGIYTEFGTNITYDHNFVRNPWNNDLPGPSIFESACIAAAVLGPTGSAVGNLVVTNNWLDGGWTEMMVGVPPGNSLTNLTITNNRFLKGIEATVYRGMSGVYTIPVTGIPTGTQMVGTLWAGTDQAGWVPVNYTSFTGSTLRGCTSGPGTLTPVSLSAGTWNNTHTWLQGNLVLFDGYYYLANHNNAGHQPDISPVYWVRTNRATIRIGSPDVPLGGLWGNGGFDSPVQLRSGSVGGTYNHSGNVWNADNTPVPNL